MKIRVRVKHGALVVRASGVLTESAAAELLEQIQKELEPRPRDVVLDLTSIESMSAGALPYMFRLQRHAGEADNRLIVAGSPEPVQRLFEMTNVAENLELVKSEADALSGVS